MGKRREKRFLIAFAITPSMSLRAKQRMYQSYPILSRIVPSSRWMITSDFRFFAMLFALLTAVLCLRCLDVMRLLPSRRTAQPSLYGTTCWCQVLGVALSRDCSNSTFIISSRDLTMDFRSAISYSCLGEDTEIGNSEELGARLLLF